MRNKTKFTIELESIIEEQVFRKIMDKHYQEIEDFKDDMIRKIEKEIRFVAEGVAQNIIKSIKENRK